MLLLQIYILYEIFIFKVACLYVTIGIFCVHEPGLLKEIIIYQILFHTESELEF